MNLDQDKLPEIPPFLRCYTINGQMLSRTIAILETISAIPAERR